MRCVLLVLLAGCSTTGIRDRGLFARIEADARQAEQHPGDARQASRSAARLADEAVVQFRDVSSVTPELAELAAAAHSLANAAVRENPVDVAARAAVVEAQVQRLVYTLTVRLGHNHAAYRVRPDYLLPPESRPAPAELPPTE